MYHEVMEQNQAVAITDFLQVNDVYNKLQKWTHEVAEGKSFREWKIFTNIILENKNVENKIQDRVEEVARHSRKEVFLKQVDDLTRKKFLNYKTNHKNKKAIEFVVNQPEANELVSINDTPWGREILFATRRFLVKKEELSKEDLSAKWQEKVHSSDEIYIRRRKRVTTFDVIAVPRSDAPIEIRIGCDLQAQGLSVEVNVSDEVLKIERSILNYITKDKVNPSHFFEDVDLFGAVDTFYRSTEGRVVELHFDCPTGASRIEKMRKNLIDLRHEEFHVAGSKVTEVFPYRIAVRWDTDNKGVYSELFLPGTRKMLLDRGGLHNVMTRNVVTSSEYRQILKTLLSYLR